MSSTLSLRDEQNSNVEDSTLPEQVTNDEDTEETGELSTMKIVQRIDNTQDYELEENSSEEMIKSTDQNEDEMDMPSTSSVPDDEVDSKRPTNSPSSSKETSNSKKESSTETKSRKRRSERLTTPRKNVAEEVDSAKPRSSRRPKKRMVALFLESDYPRNK